MSRFRIFVLFAALAVLTTAFAACGGSDKSSEDPQTVIDNATLKGVTSGNIDLSLGIKAKGDEGGNIDVSLSGPFQSGAKGNLPQLAMTASAKGSAKGENIDFEGGLTLALRPRLRRIRRDRVRSRPDHLRLRQVGLRTGAAAGQRL